MTAKAPLQSKLNFRLMALEYRLRDRLRTPAKILENAAIRPGMTVMDFGCGPGGFALAAARRVGPGGFVFAVDVHPLAAASVRKAAAKAGISWIRIIPDGDLATVPDAMIDVALAYDILHDLEDRDDAIAELARVLKIGGTLSVRDHRLKMPVLRSLLCGKGLFFFVGRSRWTLQFERRETAGETA